MVRSERAGWTQEAPKGRARWRALFLQRRGRWSQTVGKPAEPGTQTPSTKERPESRPSKVAEIRTLALTVGGGPGEGDARGVMGWVPLSLMLAGRK